MCIPSRTSIHRADVIKGSEASDGGTPVPTTRTGCFKEARCRFLKEILRKHTPKKIAFDPSHMISEFQHSIATFEN